MTSTDKPILIDSNISLKRSANEAGFPGQDTVLSSGNMRKVIKHAKINSLRKLSDDDVVQVVNPNNKECPVHNVLVGDVSLRLRDTLKHLCNVAFQNTVRLDDASIKVKPPDKKSMGKCFRIVDDIVTVESGKTEYDDLFSMYFDLVEEVGSDMPTREEVEERGSDSIIGEQCEGSVCQDAARFRESDVEESDLVLQFDDDMEEYIWETGFSSCETSTFTAYQRKPRIRVINCGIDNDM
ncbi:MAG: hypothetical protein ACKVI4_15055 [Actinomycetales bacterium]|tara:strand:- start:1010 stop:1726 length:717 start_codon:yes stop_codon:yes gene_type:complete